MTLTKLQNRILSILFYLLIVTTVFFPFKNYVSAKKYFYINSSLPLFILYLLLGTLLCIGYRRKSQAPVFTRIYGAVLILYVLAFYYNCFFYNHWYNELINKGCAFLFLLMIFTCVDTDFFRRNHVWIFVLLVAFVLCITAVIFYYAGNDTLIVRNNRFAFKIYPHGIYPDKRLTFTFPHKSAFGLMLFTLEAFVLTLLKREKRKIKYLLLPLILLIAFTTYLVNSVASTISLALLLAGFLVSLIPFRKLFQKHKVLMIFCLCLIACLGLAIFVAAFLYASKTRDLTTMGARFPIWKSSIQLIKENPMGVGNKFQTDKIQIYYGGKMNNAHNVFLNDALRFSIPVGILFFALFLVIMLFTLLKDSTFSLAFWVGTMIILNIDYSIRSDLMPLYFLLLYYIFFDTDKHPAIKALPTEASPTDGSPTEASSADISEAP